jgi:hypothetical protein
VKAPKIPPPPPPRLVGAEHREEDIAEASLRPWLAEFQPARRSRRDRPTDRAQDATREGRAALLARDSGRR